MQTKKLKEKKPTGRKSGALSRCTCENIQQYENKKAVLPQGNHAMQLVFV